MHASNMQCRAWNFAPQSKPWSPRLWLFGSALLTTLHHHGLIFSERPAVSGVKICGFSAQLTRLRKFHHVQESRWEQMITDGLRWSLMYLKWWKSSVHQPEMLVMKSVFQYTVCICSIHVHDCTCAFIMLKKERVLWSLRQRIPSFPHPNPFVLGVPLKMDQLIPWVPKNGTQKDLEKYHPNQKPCPKIRISKFVIVQKLPSGNLT